MNNTIIKHRAGSRFCLLREDYRNICCYYLKDGGNLKHNDTAASILSLFEHLLNAKIAISEAEGTTPDLWLKASLNYIGNFLLGSATQPTIIKAVALLNRLNLVQVRQGGAIASNYYYMNIDVVQAAIDNIKVWQDSIFYAKEDEQPLINLEGFCEKLPSSWVLNFFSTPTKNFEYPLLKILSTPTKNFECLLSINKEEEKLRNINAHARERKVCLLEFYDDKTPSKEFIAELSLELTKECQKQSMIDELKKLAGSKEGLTAAKESFVVYYNEKRSVLKNRISNRDGIIFEKIVPVFLSWVQNGRQFANNGKAKESTTHTEKSNAEKPKSAILTD